MSDLIRRSALLKCFCVNKDGRRIPEFDCDNIRVTVSIKDVKKIIREQPTVEAVPVVHGCNNNQNYHEVDEFRCSVCGLHLEDWVRHVHDGGAEFIKEYEFKHCPECGARMKGGAE